MNSSTRKAVALVFRSTVATGTILLLSLPSWADGEIAITGTSDEARIEASSVALDKLLSELRDKFNLSYVSSVSLNHKMISGTYAGRLTHILARVLKEHDYALKIENGHIFLVLTDQQKSSVNVKSATSAASSTPIASGGFQPASASDRLPRKGGSNSQSDKALLPTGALPPPALRKPANYEMANFMGMQLRPFVNPAASVGIPVPLTQSVDGGTSRAAIVQTTQRANLTLQALQGSLARLPQ